MPGRKPKKPSAKARARTRAHEKPGVYFPDTISIRCQAGIREQVREAAALDGVSPAEWLRGLLRKGLEASRKKRARGKRGKSLVLLALLLLPVPAAAQAPDSTANFKSWPAALTLELLAPLAGHAYAGDIDRGVYPAAVQVLGVGTVLYSAVALYDYDAVTGVFIGTGLVLVGKTRGMVSAVRTTLDHNRAVRERFAPAVALTPDGRAAIGVSVRF